MLQFKDQKETPSLEEEKKQYILKDKNNKVTEKWTEILHPC